MKDFTKLSIIAKITPDKIPTMNIIKNNIDLFIDFFYLIFH